MSSYLLRRSSSLFVTSKLGRVTFPLPGRCPHCRSVSVKDDPTGCKRVSHERLVRSPVETVGQEYDSCGTRRVRRDVDSILLKVPEASGRGKGSRGRKERHTSGPNRSYE